MTKRWPVLPLFGVVESSHPLVTASWVLPKVSRCEDAARILD